MKVVYIFVSFLFILASSNSIGKKYVAGEVIVKLKNGVVGQRSYNFMGKAHSKKQMVLKRSYGKMGLHHFSLKAGQSVEAAVEELKNDPDVEYAEPNYILNKMSVEDNIQTYSHEEVIEKFSGGSGYAATEADIKALESWDDLSATSSVTPVIAVVDTGVDVSHEVFTGMNALWVNEDEIPGNGIDDDGNGYIDDINGYNFVSNSGQMLDDDGHGTHVAGTILSVGHDIFADPLEQSRVKIMPLKFLDGNGAGSTSDAINAIYYAVNNGAHVINNSWGGPSYSAALHEAVNYSYQNRVSFVAAAGNSANNNDSAPMYPASYDVPHVVSVAATTDLDSLAAFSNFGSISVDVGSPGLFILSTYPDVEFATLSGTSMAAPFVAGMLAMMLRESPSMLPYQMKQIVFNEAFGVGALNSKVLTESRINVEDAIVFTKGAAVDTSQPAYSITSNDRALASASSGCGLVKGVQNQLNNQMKGRSRGSLKDNLWMRVFFLLAVLLIPLAALLYRRSESGENRRTYERYEIQSAVKIKVGDRELSGAVSSISLGGAKVDTSALLEKGGQVTMSITSPDGKEKIEVQGQVVWSEEKKSYGVQFNNAKESALSSISRWTKKLAKES